MWSIICNMITFDFEKDTIPWWVLVETDEVDCITNCENNRYRRYERSGDDV